jgi:hypothetical protein
MLPTGSGNNERVDCVFVLSICFNLEVSLRLSLSTDSSKMADNPTLN